MTERLIIQNFAGIQHIDIEIKKFNILIGPQASGKSICAKLLFYFKNITSEILDAVDEAGYSQENVETKFKTCFLEYFPFISWGDISFLIRYENNASFIEVTSDKTKRESVEIHYSAEYHHVISKIEEKRLEITSSDSLSQNLIVQKYNPLEFVKSQLGEFALDFQLFIPAGRSFFAIIQRSIFSLLNRKNSFDPFLVSFGAIYESVKQAQLPLFQSTSNNQMQKLAEEIVCGRYMEYMNQDFIRMLDGRVVNLATSSSGQQETLPLTMILTELPRLNGFNDRKTVYIEEPEAHIFPNAQRRLVELIAAAFNLHPGKTQFFITTHSPYVLTAVNNLLQAGEAYSLDLKGESLKKLEKLVPKTIALNVKDLAVYSITREGVESILSEELGLIDTNIIDEISNDLSIEFGQLLDLVN
jgi:AAA ATPase domain